LAGKALAMGLHTLPLRGKGASARRPGSRSCTASV